MKILTTCLTLGIIATLTACGSSGSGDDNPTVKIADQSDRVPKDYQWNPNEIIIDSKEGAVIIDISNLRKEINSHGFTKVNNYSTKLDGKYAKIDTLVLSGNKLENSFFGLIIDEGRVEGFSNGNKTKVLPKGIATYEVDAIVSNFNLENYRTINAAKIHVDFDNKSVKGEIDRTSINAQIKGNTFREETKDVTSAGGFYGDNAKEIGGIFIDNRFNELGTFGGIKE